MNQLIHREAITHSQLDHPHIIPFLGVYCEDADGPPMAVLPFAERGSLSDVIREEGVHGVEFVWIVRSIAHMCRTARSTITPTCSHITGIGCGLAYLHSRDPQVFHGDLHPVRLETKNEF